MLLHLYVNSHLFRNHLMIMNYRKIRNFKTYLNRVNMTDLKFSQNLTLSHHLRNHQLVARNEISSSFILLFFLRHFSSAISQKQYNRLSLNFKDFQSIKCACNFKIFKWYPCIFFETNGDRNVKLSVIVDGCL